MAGCTQGGADVCIRRAANISAICAISQAGGARRPLTDCDSYPLPGMLGSVSVQFAGVARSWVLVP